MQSTLVKSAIRLQSGCIKTSNLPLSASILPVECDRCNHAQRQPGYCEDQRTERLMTTRIAVR